jgi:hypothetical protein
MRRGQRLIERKTVLRPVCADVDRAGQRSSDTSTQFRAANKLRSLLREYDPSLLATFADLTSSDPRATLGLAPTPAAATTLRRPTLRAALPGPGAAATSTARCDESLPAKPLQPATRPAGLSVLMRERSLPVPARHGVGRA